MGSFESILCNTLSAFTPSHTALACQQYQDTFKISRKLNASQVSLTIKSLGLPSRMVTDAFIQDGTEFLRLVPDSLRMPRLHSFKQVLSRLQPLLEHEHILSALQAPALQSIYALARYGLLQTLGDSQDIELLNKDHTFPTVWRLKYNFYIPLDYKHLRRIWEHFPNVRELHVELMMLQV